MQSYLEAQGLWRLMQKGPPAALESGAKPEDQKYYDEKLDKFKEADSKAKAATLRSLVLLHWEQRSGKKPQQQQQKAQKITAVKWGSNDAPSFSEQKGDSQKKKTRRSKKKKPTAQNVKEQEDLASGEAEQGYAQIASPIFLPRPTALRRPVRPTRPSQVTIVSHRGRQSLCCSSTLILESR